MQSGKETTVEISPAKGSYPGMPSSRAYEIRLPGDWPPEAMDCARAPEDVVGKDFHKWRFEGNTLTTVIDVPETKITGKVTVRVIRSADLMSRRSELNGFAGSMTRLNDARYTLQHAWPFDNVPDEVVDAAQTGDKLGYYPRDASKILAHYREVLPKAKAKVDEMVNTGISNEEKQALEKRLGETWHTPETQAAVADYPNKLKRAQSYINDAMGLL
jgi:alpha-glucosidase